MSNDTMINHSRRAFFSFGFVGGGILQVLVWPLLCLVLAMWLWYWTLTKIDTEKREVEKKVLAEAAVLCKDYGQYLGQAIDRANQITLQLQYGWEQSHGRLNLQELSQSGLFRNPQINNVIVVNREGRPVTATAGQLQNISFADRDYFVYHKNDDSKALLIGKPLVSRTTGNPAIAFTRRLDTPQGAFDGVALAGFDPHYLTSFYAGAFPGKTGLLMVAGLDGTLRSSTIGSASQESTPAALRAVPLFNSAEGALYLSGEQWFGDKLSRYVAWKTLEDYPLVAMVGLSEQEYFGPYQGVWATDRRLAISGSLILFLFALVATWMSTRIVRKKHQEEEVRKTYRIATEGGREGYYMYEALHDKTGFITDFVLVDCNECGAEFYGIPQTQLLQMKLSSLFPAACFDELVNNFRRAMASGFHEDETRTPSDSRLQIEWTKTRAVRSGNGLAVTVQDISERKRAEAELRRMNERFVLATSAGQVGVWDWDIPNNELLWDNSMYHLYGIRKEDFGGAYDAWARNIHPQDKAYAEGEIQAALRGEREYAPEFRIIRPDGTIRYLKADSQTFRDTDNKPLRMIGTNIDITERKWAQTQLERYRDHLEHQKDLLQSVLENTPIRVFWKDTDLRYLGCNQLFAQDAGMGGPDELIGKSDFDMGWRDQAALYQADDRVVMTSGIPKLDFEEPQTTPDGKTVWLSTSKVPLRGKDQQVIGILGIYADITERKLDEEALRRLNRELHAISNCNQALMRAENEKTLLDAICRIICDEAGYRMVWVGYRENDVAKIIRPVAWAGIESGYLAQAGITWADTERGHGPSGTAIRTGKSSCIRDFSTDPSAAPWREAALQRGYRSCISLPLKDENANSFGTLTIYSAESNTFTPDEIRLLEELTGDMAFGIRVLRTRVERGQAGVALAQSENMYRTLAENSPDVIVRYDRQGRRIYVNPEFERVNRLTAQQVLGKTPAEVSTELKPRADAFTERLMAAMESGIADKVDLSWHKDGKQICWFVRVVPEFDADGKVTSALTIWSDITQRKWEQAELERYRDHLERLVQERTVELQEARVAAEAANRAKSGFLANMSHELRTPLNAILGFAELMEHDQAIPQAQKRNLNTINRSGRHLLTLINDILDLSKIEAGRLTTQIQACDLRDLIETTFEAMELRAHQKGLALNVHLGDDVPIFISTDPGKLRQILINLLSNAVKFTAHGGIDLEVSASDWNSQMTRLTLVFVVCDTGVGIAEEELDHIFQPFYQAEHGIRSGEGTGLGLTIARQFAQLLGGELVAASAVDKGSTFTVRLPVDVADTMAAVPAHRRVVALAEGQTSKRILVVEDKEDNQLLLTQLLEQVGLETRIAANGKEALAAFEAWHPHFIWMDMRMPVMDGYEATRRIRTMSGGREVKIAALTASAFREDRGAIIAAGCDDVLSKPIEEEQLFSAMERLLGLRYRYAEQASASVAAPASGADLAGLPMDLRQELSHAAQILDEESAYRAIDHIRAIDARLAEELEELVRAYRYDQIVTLCEEPQGTSR